METKFQCPKCKRPIVSRRNKLCQYCGAALPEHLLFTKAEIEKQDRFQEEDRMNRERREKAREEIQEAEFDKSHRYID